MRIVDLRVRIFKAPIADPIHMSFSSLQLRQMAVIEIEADDGTVGLGESWINFPPWAGRERVATIREGIAPLVVGETLDSVRRVVAALHSNLRGFARQGGTKGPIWQAISGVEVGLWDLYARVRQVPLYELLGGAIRTRVPLYASGLDRFTLSDLAMRCLDEGFGGLKLRVGFKKHDDIEAIQQASEILGSRGDSTHLYLDVNQAWSLREAVDVLLPVRDLGISWIEEPITGNPIDELEDLYRRVGIPIAVGENLYGVGEFLPYVRSPAIAAVQPDVSKVGGVSEMLAICALSEACHKPVVPHWYGGAIALAATLQVAAAHPGIQYVEFDVRENPFRDDVLTRPFDVSDGSVAVPEGPGLGIEISDSFVRDYEEVHGA